MYCALLSCRERGALGAWHGHGSSIILRFYERGINAISSPSSLDKDITAGQNIKDLRNVLAIVMSCLLIPLKKLGLELEITAKLVLLLHCFIL